MLKNLEYNNATVIVNRNVENYFLQITNNTGYTKESDM